MTFFVVASVIFFLYILIFKILNLKSRAAPPHLEYIESKFNKAVLEACPIFREPYVPTSLWGKSGHIQTGVYGKVGRFQAPRPKGIRKHIMMPDGGTVSYDMFEATAEHPSGGDYTICCVPGISNSCEKAYVRGFIAWAQSQGYRVACLNHIGALENQIITSPRIFTYGDTEEYDEVVKEVRAKFPHSTLLSIGFSMGANIVVKYLGEEPHRQDYFLCAVSVCQGYDITKWAQHAPDKDNPAHHRATVTLHEWNDLRRVYNFLMTKNMMKTIRRNHDMLFGEQAKAYWKAHNLPPIIYDVEKILNSTSLVHLDEAFTYKMKGCKDILDFYKKASSSAHIHKVHIPMLMLNAADDLIIPPHQVTTPGEYVQNAPKGIYALTKHGGHLGFFEGGILRPNTVSWMDRAVTQYLDGVIEVTQQQDLRKDIIQNGVIRN
ncbi:monoacylglycerol lipase ABHD2-like [Amphiura filiformis]|uniref:monoacylglycerol lipase ABHD2-like n=1 Tax=Amphiura filiformis TaxID=82378 RepID=UPI003B220DF2